MNFLICAVIFIVSGNLLKECASVYTEDTGMYNLLEREMRNRECCQKRMNCCKTPKPNPELELRAVMSRCPNTVAEDSVLTRQMQIPLSEAKETVVKQFQGFEPDEPLVANQLQNCHKKVIVTMRIKNRGVASNKSQYIVVDHVFNTATRTKERLLNPYVIKLNQEPLKQRYPLTLKHVVNAEATEQVINKKSRSFKGCDFTSKRPTCGLIKYNGRVVPYSQGFCCSCDHQKNEERQKSTKKSHDPNVPLIIYSDPSYLLDGVECPRHLKGWDQNGVSANRSERYLVKKNRKTDADDRSQMDPMAKRGDPLTFAPNPQEVEDVIMNALTSSDDYTGDNDFDDRIKNLEKFLAHLRERESREKRQTYVGVQMRGGQDCSDHFVPKRANPDTYHDSAHCLRFSDLWYNVYQLREPSVRHRLRIQVFEKQEDSEGKTEWHDLTQGKPLYFGTNIFRHNFRNIVAADYSVMENFKPDPKYFSLNFNEVFLLVPEGVSKTDTKNHPEVANGPSEYLVVHPSQVSVSGDLCNTAGVGFEAFFKQPNRCLVPKGSCLANQPRHLWLHDHEAEKRKKKGCFFLKHYGDVTKESVTNKNGQIYLYLLYSGMHNSLIDLEIRADFNTIIRLHSSAIITEVYVESTNPKQTLVTIKVTNSGLLSNTFHVKLGDCPLDLPSDLNNVESKPVLIPPQKQHIFYLKIRYVLPTERFHCSVEVVNEKKELVALRRIRIQKYDRCVCAWHCLCVCMASSDGLKCKPMSLTHYHAAGFQGSIPIESFVIEYSSWDDVLSMFYYLSGFLMLTVIILGLSKAIIGLFCSPEIGVWGLDVLMDPKQIRCYYEKGLEGRRVIYNEAGWPVHPDTGRKVRNMSLSAEFCLNILFFFTYPSMVLFLLIKRVCWPYYSCDNCFLENKKKKSKWTCKKNKNKSKDAKSKSIKSDECSSKNNSGTTLIAMIDQLSKPIITKRKSKCRSSSEN